MAGPIITRETTVDVRHNVHEASNSMGCKTTSSTLDNAELA